MAIPEVRAQGPVRRQEAPEGGWPPGGPYLRSPGVSSCSALWLKGEPLPAHLLLTPHPRAGNASPMEGVTVGAGSSTPDHCGAGHWCLGEWTQVRVAGAGARVGLLLRASNLTHFPPPPECCSSRRRWPLRKGQLRGSPVVVVPASSAIRPTTSPAACLVASTAATPSARSACGVWTRQPIPSAGSPAHSAARAPLHPAAGWPCWTSTCPSSWPSEPSGSSGLPPPSKMVQLS